MPEHRFPATAGQFHGELRLSSDGVTFVPVTTREGDQMVLGVDGWQLGWDDVAGFERVDAFGNLRLHYDGASRFVRVRVHGSGTMRELFAVADQLVATSVAQRVA